MGLRIWLPLLNNLDNKGTSNFNITSVESSPTYVDGKIGKCYQRANSSSQLTNGLKIDNNLVDLFGSTASVTVWVKPLGTHTHYNGTILSSGNWNAKKWAFGVSQDNTKVDVLCGSYNNYITCAVPINEWTHLASIYDNGVCTLYKNGIYIGQLTGQAAFVSDADWTGIGRETYAGGYFGFNGCIADLRVFDHCLSAAEVREISQGLVLHYKLDKPANINNNLYVGSEKFTGSWGGSGNWTTSTETYQNFVVKQRSGTWGGLHQNIPCTNGDIFTISFYAKVDSGGQIMSIHRSSLGNVTTGLNILGGNFSSSTNWITTTQDGTQWNRYWATVQIASADITYLQWRIENNQSGKNLYICGIKLEKGTVATPWSPAASEAGETNIIQDSSGYNHNGTILNTVSMSSDTPRYSYSTKLEATNSMINCGRGGMVKDSITINFWCKYSSWGNPVSCTEGGGWNMENNGGSITFPVYISSVGYVHSKNGTGAESLPPASYANAWHMFTGTYNRVEKTVSLYIDGELKQQNIASAGNNIAYHSSNCIWIGAEATGSNTTASNGMAGLFSDFRIYCTALNADAIRQLYEVGAKVDNKQNLHSFELIENQSKIEISKTGQARCNELEETTATKFFKTDQIIETNNFIEI